VTEPVPAWIVEAETAVERAAAVEANRGYFDALQDFDVQLTEITTRLQKVARSAALGQGSWWQGFHPERSLWADLDAVERRSVQVDKRRATNLIRTLGEFRVACQTEVGAAWARHVVATAGVAVELRGVAQALRGTSSLSGAATRLDGVLGRLAQHRQTMPEESDVQALEEAQALVSDLRRLLPERVRDFVIAASHPGGAPLELLDDQVREWLAEKGMIGAVRVVFAAGADAAHD
jgi:hypothetical protein